MSNSATSQVTFEAWCARLHPSPHIAPDHQRSSIPSFDVNNCVVPVSIHQWYEFPSFVTAWKAEMYSRGLGESTTFAKFAGLATQYYTTGGLLSSLIRCDEHTRYYLGEFYKMVNYFNLDYHQILAPDQQPPHPSTEIYADPIVALGVISNPDTLITNGETEMNKVGLGIVKSPWVVTLDSVSVFMDRLPFSISARTSLLHNTKTPNFSFLHNLLHNSIVE